MINSRLFVNRLKLIASGGASRIIVSLQSVITSFIIIRWHSATLWGEAVVYILFLDLGFSIVAWGTSPYLIRAISFHPKKMKEEWSKSFWSRSALLAALCVAILCYPVSVKHQLILLVWALSRYVYHSYESIIQFERKFILSLIAEGIGLVIVLVPIIIFSEKIELTNLLILLTASSIAKSQICLFSFRTLLSPPTFSRQYFIVAFPFLLLTFSAMLQQRADLYCVAYLLPKKETATYQVFINLIIFGQFMASLLLSPFAKNIYRLPKNSLLKLEKRFMLSGIVFSALSIGGIFIAIQYLYQLTIDPTLYIIGYFYILAFYFYLLKNFELGKQLQQLRVTVFSLIASVVNIAFSIWLTPLFQLRGALLAGLAGQLVLIVLYHSKFATRYADR
jgi:O-antigen/teichoic acid export membrane protein